MNVFISTPMSGRKEEDVWKDIDTVKKLYPSDNVIYSFDIKYAPTEIKHPHLWYLGKAFQKLAEADKVVFIPGWEKSRGCMSEYDIAVKYNIPREYLSKKDLKEI